MRASIESSTVMSLSHLNVWLMYRQHVSDCKQPPLTYYNKYMLANTEKMTRED